MYSLKRRLKKYRLSSIGKAQKGAWSEPEVKKPFGKKGIKFLINLVLKIKVQSSGFLALESNPLVFLLIANKNFGPTLF